MAKKMPPKKPNRKKRFWVVMGSLLLFTAFTGAYLYTETTTRKAVEVESLPTNYDQLTDAQVSNWETVPFGTVTLLVDPDLPQAFHTSLLSSVALAVQEGLLPQWEGRAKVRWAGKMMLRHNASGYWKAGFHELAILPSLPESGILHELMHLAVSEKDKDKNGQPLVNAVATEVVSHLVAQTFAEDPAKRLTKSQMFLATSDALATDNGFIPLGSAISGMQGTSIRYAAKAASEIYGKPLARLAFHAYAEGSRGKRISLKEFLDALEQGAPGVKAVFQRYGVFRDIFTTDQAQTLLVPLRVVRDGDAMAIGSDDSWGVSVGYHLVANGYTKQEERLLHPGKKFALLSWVLGVDPQGHLTYGVAQFHVTQRRRGIQIAETDVASDSKGFGIAILDESEVRNGDYFQVIAYSGPSVKRTGWTVEQ